LADSLAFSDLSPKALGMILADCEAAKPMEGYRPDEYAKMGRRFWHERQSGAFPADFPPLTISLRDDGKIVLAVKS
jgi:hypothetical protein